MPTDGESIQVWVVHLAGQTAESWRPVLSASEWSKAMRFRSPADQARSAVTRGALKALLARYLALPALAIEFTHNEFGKPALAGSPIQFNVSHSGDYAVLAFSKSASIGVDVEHIISRRVVHELASRVMTSAEYGRFLSLPAADHERRFFEIWTLKESVLKAIGSGFSIAPEEIELAFHSHAPRLLAAPNKDVQDIDEWSLTNLDIGNVSYAAALAVRQAPLPTIEINHFEWYSPDNT